MPQREEIMVVFGTDTTSVDRALRSMGQKFKDFGREVAEGLNPLKLLGGLAGGFAIEKIVEKMSEFVRKIVEFTGEMKKNAEATGVSTTYLQQFGFAAEQSNVSQEDASKGLEKLTKKIGEARSGNEEAQKAFKRWGIALDDANGKALSTEKIVDAIADAMRDTADETQKAALASEFFDKSWAGMTAILKDGAKALAELRAQANVITPDQIKSIDALESSWKQMKATVLADAGQVLGTFSQLVELYGALNGLGASATRKLAMNTIADRLLFGIPSSVQNIRKLLGMDKEEETPGLTTPPVMATDEEKKKLKEAEDKVTMAREEDDEKLKDLILKYQELNDQADQLLAGTKEEVKARTEAAQVLTQAAELEKKIAEDKERAEERFQAMQERGRQKALKAVESIKDAQERADKERQKREGFTLEDLTAQGTEFDPAAGIRGRRQRRAARRAFAAFANNRTAEDQVAMDLANQAADAEDAAKNLAGIGHFTEAKYQKRLADDIKEELYAMGMLNEDPAEGIKQEGKRAADALALLLELATGGGINTNDPNKD